MGRSTLVTGCSSPLTCCIGEDWRAVMATEVETTAWTLFEPLERCPACLTASLTCTAAGDLVKFVCASCGNCWHVELGCVYRVDPLTCPGCRWRHVCEGSVRGLAPSGSASGRRPSRAR